MAERKKRSESGAAPPGWEWMLAGVGALLVAGVVGAMIYRGATGDDRPPSFEISVESITESGGGYVAAFRVKNLGSQTAANLGIEGTLRRTGGESESATTNLTYVPGDSERQGGLFFKNDPRQAQLELRATGYEKP